MPSLVRIIESAELVAEAREVGFPEELCRRMYSLGYEEAREEAARNRLHEEQVQQKALARTQESFRQRIEEAEARGYRAGLQQVEAQRRLYEQHRARRHVPPPPRPPPSAPPPAREQSRHQLVSEMLEQCRVISESNPNMAPGVNAVRHRIKKLAEG